MADGRAPNPVRKRPRVDVVQGDSRDVLARLADGCMDAVVTDPPYALVSIRQRLGRADSAPIVSNGASGVYARAGAGFMGQTWDTGETAFDPAFWAEVLRVLKPGGHIVAASGTRTYHRLACAIEDAGFEIRDMVSWLYGSGFPKSHNHDIGGVKFGTALKPACEPWVLARKPLCGTVAETLDAHGTGALNIDGCRIEGEKTPAPVGQFRGSDVGATGLTGIRDGRSDHLGRWPANVVHDGSDEVLDAFPATEAAGGYPAQGARYGLGGGVREQRGEALKLETAGGSAARFFYSAKADDEDRLGADHPTVKPVALMRWLCRLITPPGARVLDPFAGSGSTGVACLGEGFDALLIEREPDYVATIRRRLAWARGEGALTDIEKARLDSPAKRLKAAGADTPLFGEWEG